MIQQQLMQSKLTEQKRKIILLFKEYKIYPQFRAVVNLMAAIADYAWGFGDVPEFFKTNSNPYNTRLEQEKTHIGQFNKQEIESLMEWITKTFKDVRNLVIDKEQNNLTQKEIIDKYYNIVDKYGNIIVSPLLRVIAEIPSRLYLMQTYKQLENKTFNIQ